ncbi:MAG: hypothetical protein A4E29_00137 [Methanomassiliicoccales archaeon PtaB.Bin134]|nr:MAG: hypothetical protein A4E29_00137 [Methanomassiliicoccales archaeon PtaB.Bin134]
MPQERSLGQRPRTSFHDALPFLCLCCLGAYGQVHWGELHAVSHDNHLLGAEHGDDPVLHADLGGLVEDEQVEEGDGRVQKGGDRPGAHHKAGLHRKNTVQGRGEQLPQGPSIPISGDRALEYGVLLLALLRDVPEGIATVPFERPSGLRGRYLQALAVQFGKAGRDALMDLPVEEPQPVVTGQQKVVPQREVPLADPIPGALGGELPGRG